uniref:Uncharacterized protein n=1 Tax=Opuntia streptacantha TaxID=393608 RepID=A0A7C9ANI1_OPUST
MFLLLKEEGMMLVGRPITGDKPRLQKALTIMYFLITTKSLVIQSGTARNHRITIKLLEGLILRTSLLLPVPRMREMSVLADEYAKFSLLKEYATGTSRIRI